MLIILRKIQVLISKSGCNESCDDEAIKLIEKKSRILYNSGKGLPFGGSVTLLWKEVASMKNITYSELFQFCILISDVIMICIMAFK